MADPFSCNPSFRPVAAAAVAADAHILHTMLNVTTRSRSAPQPTQPTQDTQPTQLTPAAATPVMPPQPAAPIPDSVEPAGDTVRTPQTILADQRVYAKKNWIAVNLQGLQKYV